MAVGILSVLIIVVGLVMVILSIRFAETDAAVAIDDLT